MINGYVNLPEELQNLSDYGAMKHVEGIYNKIVTISKLNKPVVGKAIINGSEIAITWSIAYLGQGEYAIKGAVGDSKLALTVNNGDNVYPSVS